MTTRTHHARHLALVVLLWAASGTLVLISYWTGASGNLSVFLLTGLAAVAPAILAYSGRSPVETPDLGDAPERDDAPNSR
ncbi:hypothetical protein CAE01nite_08060 [Cellulomonas aerilata]|uniref:Uncharacterized protein n=1 Tax=Cellulomonas aerilata TaxID=515326 RepID=A0A512D9G1_9CELL|nr:hypothetical protein CAE01nite_08060 [Cellulomonas aerilata]